jgi:hypothetical protein
MQSIRNAIACFLTFVGLMLVSYVVRLLETMVLQGNSPFDYNNPEWRAEMREYRTERRLNRSRERAFRRDVRSVAV